MSRLETLIEWVEKDPNDVFSLYGLAMEYAKTGDADRALSVFDDIMKRFPEYVAAYYHMGKTYESVERLDEAKAVYERGIAAAKAAGDGHAVSELEEALEELGK